MNKHSKEEKTFDEMQHIILCWISDRVHGNERPVISNLNNLHLKKIASTIQLKKNGTNDRIIEKKNTLIYKALNLVGISHDII